MNINFENQCLGVGLTPQEYYDPLKIAVQSTIENVEENEENEENEESEESEMEDDNRSATPNNQSFSASSSDESDFESRPTSRIGVAEFQRPYSRSWAEIETSANFQM